MKARCLFFSVLLVALAGCGRMSPGEALWRQNCSQCHGIDGNGNTIGYMGETYADLRDDLWRTGGSDGAMEISIRNGSFGKMPAFPQLTPEEVRAILDHIRVLRGEKSPGTGS